MLFYTSRHSEDQSIVNDENLDLVNNHNEISNKFNRSGYADDSVQKSSIPDIPIECPKPSEPAANRKFNDAFLDFYSSFTGTTENDKLAWQAQSFKDPKDS
jgi:hypothetical protein